jgi:hypothetical protein
VLKIFGRISCAKLAKPNRFGYRFGPASYDEGIFDLLLPKMKPMMKTFIWRANTDARHGSVVRANYLILKQLGAGALLTLALAAPAASQPSDTKILRIVPFADLQTIDPINTTAGNVQSHGVMIYDFQFGRDEAQSVKPQMVKTWTMTPDGLLWQFTLREGLAFHDGAPVTSDDVIASLKRWGARDPLRSPTDGGDRQDERP